MLLKVLESEHVFHRIDDSSLNASSLFTGTAVVFLPAMCAAVVWRAVAQLPRYNGSGASPAPAVI